MYPSSAPRLLCFALPARLLAICIMSQCQSHEQRGKNNETFVTLTAKEEEEETPRELRNIASLPASDHSITHPVLNIHGHRITSHSFTVPFFPSPPPICPPPPPLLPFCENTSQNRSVSSPAPVTMVPPSGLMLRYSTRYV